tara:strand:+ start:155 stop:463 length:309 start_codon:yes stop_codon:yes gene_type:complete
MPTPTIEYKELPKSFKLQIAKGLYDEFLQSKLPDWMDMRCWRAMIEVYIGGWESSLMFDDKTVCNFDTRSIFDIMHKDKSYFIRSPEPLGKRYNYKINNKLL